MNIFNLSFGKDSMATLLLALEQGVKVDRVMYVDIRFDSEISGEHPIMAEWIPTAEKILREKFGIVVDHAYSGVTYCEQFYREKTKGKHIGDKYGFPHIIGAWCNDRLKVKAIQKYMAQFKGQEITHFVGIAADEPKRWARMQAKETGRVKYRSLLVGQNLTEQDAVAICKQYNLLSHTYGVDGIFRGGVGFVRSNVCQTCTVFGKTTPTCTASCWLWNPTATIHLSLTQVLRKSRRNSRAAMCRSEKRQ